MLIWQRLSSGVTRCFPWAVAHPEAYKMTLCKRPNCHFIDKATVLQTRVLGTDVTECILPSEGVVR